MRDNLGDAKKALDSALEKALHIEAVTRIEEKDNEPRTSAIQSNEDSQLVDSIIDLVRTMESSQPNRQDNQKLSLRGRRSKEFLAGEIEILGKSEIEVENTTAMTKAAQVKNEPFITVERRANTRRQKQKLRSIARDSSRSSQMLLRL